jgi:hypothetical protein
MNNRWSRLFCCRAPAASGHAIAAPPSSVIITPFHVFHLCRDPHASCVVQDSKFASVMTGVGRKRQTRLWRVTTLCRQYSKSGRKFLLLAPVTMSPRTVCGPAVQRPALLVGFDIPDGHACRRCRPWQLSGQTIDEFDPGCAQRLRCKAGISCG